MASVEVKGFRKSKQRVSFTPYAWNVYCFSDILTDDLRLKLVSV